MFKCFASLCINLSWYFQKIKFNYISCWDIGFYFIEKGAIDIHPSMFIWWICRNVRKYIENLKKHQLHRPSPQGFHFYNSFDLEVDLGGSHGYNVELLLVLKVHPQVGPGAFSNHNWYIHRFLHLSINRSIHFREYLKCSSMHCHGILCGVPPISRYILWKIRKHLPQKHYSDHHSSCAIHSVNSLSQTSKKQ